MQIRETPIFTRQIQDTLSDDEYRRMQAALVENPELGSGAGVGGLRKLRWGIEGGGKRGGIRVIYY